MKSPSIVLSSDMRLDVSNVAPADIPATYNAALDIAAALVADRAAAEKPRRYEAPIDWGKVKDLTVFNPFLVAEVRVQHDAFVVACGTGNLNLVAAALADYNQARVEQGLGRFTPPPQVWVLEHEPGITGKLLRQVEQTILQNPDNDPDVRPPWPALWATPEAFIGLPRA